MISPLLIFFVWREGSHWVLAALPFIRGLWPPNSMRMKKCRSYLQATRGFGIFPFIVPYWTGPISVPPPLYGRFYFALVSARLGMTLVPFWGSLSSNDVMTKNLWLLGLKTPVQHNLVKKHQISNPPLGVILTHEILMGQQSHLVRRLSGRSSGH